MSFMKVSDQAYEEFKGFLVNTNVQNFNLRITYVGRNCNGLTFNLDYGVKGENDVEEQVKDITFIIDKDALEEFEGFTILSNEENNGEGLELKALKVPESPCTVCPGC
ncbi:HesB family protein [Clostridium pasteurianum DSM 525 = ATCC 6013]|uniref:HesB family protein n=1 Tax=Clostridium pasteurianum DSM 525 = ATCC 6013 TaxID=1262449 RepID=A0A0H3J6U2_CLOPA|nr:HesB-like protein [Clostridium pasteurianum]AJA47633.1 HesB family protein [Clostridium pasteurianum DSM 525 = ATCC 6013]AJA51621.1 HesB family protein [Clostridium pasteurianum DSM 525 = ATCC 6013]AOZ74943.1 Fe-S cluster assembly protein HesB [Clostridium pasteurianum DSM 525 = ATCC 6013]AOZ78738.1 Fe-S cluster assembly protein HesB [Clostridium pasteurianum]ELP58027.1 HesB family protein [Clostridium pasteurianum DSM 525 = ATCC 6013]